MISSDSGFEHLTEDVMIRVNRLCNEFEERWRRGDGTPIEAVLDGVEEALRPTLLKELLPLEIGYRRRAGMDISIDQYMQRFPNVARDWLEAALRDTEDQGALDNFGAAAPPTRLGDYAIVRRVGSGGMGTVYEAHHERMGRTVAIKVLRPELANQPRTMERFMREIRAAASLSHPNIVAAYDSREENGVAYLVTEFVEGMNLSDLVKQRGPLPSAVAIEIIVQTARGLQYAHEQGVVHRDIKPHNLMVRWRDKAAGMRAEAGTDSPSSSLWPFGSAKILDLGLARLRSDADSELTNTNVMMGTAAYMAPEQALRPKQVDHRADIYSLGCTMYYLLTGRPVFAGESVFETALAHANQPAPTLSHLRPDVAAVLDPIMARMLAKDPADRYQSMAGVIAALSSAANLLDKTAGAPDGADATWLSGPQQPIVQGQDSSTTAVDGEVARTFHLAGAPSKRRRVLAVGGMLCLLAGGVIGFVFWPDKPERDDVQQRRRDDDRAIKKAGRWALSFNGKTSYVEAASPGAATEPITMEAIVTVREARIGVVAVWLHGGWHAGFGLNLDGRWGLGYCRVENKGGVSRFQPHYATAFEPVPTLQRIHLAAVFNGDEPRLFVNGKEQPLHHEQGAAPRTLNRIFIGRYPPPEILPDLVRSDRFFNGLIHAVRISKDIRYKANFEPPKVLDARPGDDSILAFVFEEGAENVVHDVLGRATAKIIDAEWVQP